MASGSCECGCFAFVSRVEMNSVLTRRKVLKIEIDLDAFPPGPSERRAVPTSLPIPSFSVTVTGYWRQTEQC